MLLLGGQPYRNLNRGGVSSPSDGMGHALSPPLREASLCHAKGLISLQPVLPMCPPPSWPGKQDVIYIRVSLELGVAPGLVFKQYSRGWSLKHVQRGNKYASQSLGSSHSSVLLGRQLRAFETQKVAWVFFHFAYFESHKNSGQDNFFSTPVV